MLGGIGVGIFFQIRILITFQILDDTTGNQLQVGLATAETEERTTIDKRRAGYAHVHLLSSVVEEHLHIVLQLGTAYNGIVAEKQTFARHHGAIGNEFHLSYQITEFLIAGCETARPCGSIFRHGTMIRYTFSFRISQAHTYTRVGNTTDAIHLGLVLSAHLVTTAETDFLNITSFVT